MAQRTLLLDGLALPAPDGLAPRAGASAPPGVPRHRRADRDGGGRGRGAPAPRSAAADAAGRRLARYRLPHGMPREVVALAGAAGSTVLVDRLAGGMGDSRLVAHLAADEPEGNVELVCGLYLAAPYRGECRRVEDADLAATPAGTPGTASAEEFVGELRDRDGNRYRLAVLDDKSRTIRWTRTPSAGEPASVVSVRDVIGGLEEYEPARSMCREALESAGPGVFTGRLRWELESVEHDPRVLNRGLREAVLRAVAHGEKLADIALRCGRKGSKSSGWVSGDTS